MFSKHNYKFNIIHVFLGWFFSCVFSMFVFDSCVDNNRGQFIFLFLLSQYAVLSFGLVQVLQHTQSQLYLCHIFSCLETNTLTTRVSFWRTLRISTVKLTESRRRTTICRSSSGGSFLFPLLFASFSFFSL